MPPPGQMVTDSKKNVTDFTTVVKPANTGALCTQHQIISLFISELSGKSVHRF